MATKKHILIAACLASVSVLLLCVPRQNTTNETSFKNNHNLTLPKSSNLDSDLKDSIEIDKINNLKENIKSTNLEEVKTFNAKSYFQLKKVQSLSESELNAIAKMTPDEKKAAAMHRRIEESLIANLESRANKR